MAEASHLQRFDQTSVFKHVDFAGAGVNQVALESGPHLLEGVFRRGEEGNLRLPTVLGIVLRVERFILVPVPFRGPSRGCPGVTPACGLG